MIPQPTTKLFIDGKFVESNTTEWIDIHNPVSIGNTRGLLDPLERHWFTLSLKNHSNLISAALIQKLLLYILSHGCNVSIIFISIFT